MAKIEKTETTQTLDYWLSRPYLSEDVKNGLSRAKVLVVPHEGFRGKDIRSFPVGTESFLEYLGENLPGDVPVEIAINDEDYNELALHSALLIIGSAVVGSFLAPILVNVVSEYVNRRLSGEKQKKETTVRWELTVVDGTRAAKLSYEGPAIEFQPEIQKALSDFALPAPPQPQLPSPSMAKDKANDKTVK